MLGRINTSQDHLYVPKLVHLDEKAVINSNKHGGRTIELNLYKLDWDKVDAHKQKHFLDHRNAYHLAGLPATLPAHYDGVVKGFLFAISHDYLVEIQHFSQLYFIERLRVRNFDTCIREMCLQPAEAAINCAFKLLADCLYDDENQAWFRDNDYLDKQMARCLLMYKFWRGNTGRGLVWDHAELDKLRSAMIMQIGADARSKTAIARQRLLDDMSQWQQQQEVFWQQPMGSAVEMVPQKHKSRTTRMPIANEEASSDLKAYYANQEVRGEKAIVASGGKSVVACLINRPFVPGTVVLDIGRPCQEDIEKVSKPSSQVGITDEARIMRITFGPDGRVEIVKRNTMNGYYNVYEYSGVDEDGQVKLVLSEPLPPGTIALVDYEYTASQ